MAWDVIIVGAGPAGSALATLVASSDCSVLLLDRAVFPRDKLCGEFLNPGCVEMLRAFGVLARIEALSSRIHGMRVSAPEGAECVARYPSGRYGLAVRRSVVDHLLLRNSLQLQDVQFVEGFRVERLLVENGAVCGVSGRHRSGEPEAFRAKVTVGADGAYSQISHCLGLFRASPSHRRLCLGVHYQGIEVAAAFPEVYLGAHRYAILNPLPDGSTNVNLVLDVRDFRKTPGSLGSFFQEAVETIPAAAARLRPGRPVEPVRALGPLASRAARASAPGALLVGDAAEFYDPFTGEGVFMALRGAHLAAHTIGDALRADNFTARFLARYDAARSRELRGRFRLEALVQAVIGRPWLARLAVRQLHRSRPAAETLMAVLGGILPPRSLAVARSAARL